MGLFYLEIVVKYCRQTNNVYDTAKHITLFITEKND
jgi:hypothetical protein